jgi:dihydrofolate reductase
MSKLTVFNHTSLDGYFTDAKGDMSFAYAGTDDPEWNEFVAGNTSSGASGGTLVFGRVTYQMMASFWPTPAAGERMPAVADHMNTMAKVVFSKTLNDAPWQNTTLVKTDPVAEIQKRKQAPQGSMVVLGSGTIVSQLAQANVIDEYQIIVNPVALGAGRTLFEGVTARRPLKLIRTRAFRNGKVLLCYEPAAD